MSTLVGYGSSSDEDDDATEDVVQPPTSAQSRSGPELSGPQPNLETAIKQTWSESTKPEDAPIIGPTAPANGLHMADTEIESIQDEAEAMSDREAIRHLTQTTHPMSSMPSSPPGSPDPAANTRFKRFLELKTKGVHFNQDLAGKSTFRNPSLLSNMMSRAGIEEEEQYSTSLPRELWGPMDLPSAGYKEELLKSQQAIRDKDEINKKQLSAAGKRTIGFTSAGRSGNSSRDSTPGLHNKRRKP